MDDIETAWLVHYHQYIPEWWPYFRLENMIDKLKDYLEKKKAAEEGKSSEGTHENPDASKMMRDAQRSMPKMPTTTNFKMPKI